MVVLYYHDNFFNLFIFLIKTQDWTKVTAHQQKFNALKAWYQSLCINTLTVSYKLHLINKLTNSHEKKYIFNGIVYGRGEDEPASLVHDSDFESDADVEGEYSQSAQSDFSQSTLYKQDQLEEGSDEEYYNL